MQLEQMGKPKVLVLGGVEAVPYEQLVANVDVSYIPHVKKFRNAHLTSFDAIVMLTSQLSHAVVKKVKKVACKHDIPLYFLTSSGGTRFKCLLEEICGTSCQQKCFWLGAKERL